MLIQLIALYTIHHDAIKNELVMRKKSKIKLRTYRVWHKTEFGVGCELIKAENKKSLKIPKRIKAGFLYAEKE